MHLLKTFPQRYFLFIRNIVLLTPLQTRAPSQPPVRTFRCRDRVRLVEMRCEWNRRERGWTEGRCLSHYFIQYKFYATNSSVMTYRSNIRPYIILSIKTNICSILWFFNIYIYKFSWTFFVIYRTCEHILLTLITKVGLSLEVQKTRDKTHYDKTLFVISYCNFYKLVCCILSVLSVQTFETNVSRAKVFSWIKYMFQLFFPISIAADDFW